MTSASTFSDPSEQKRPSSDESDRVKVANATHDHTKALPERPFPNLNGNHFLHGHIPGQSEVHVIMTQAALGQIRAHSISNLRTELGGVLLGHAYRHGEQLFVEVTATLPAVSSDHGPVHFTFSADSWTQIHKDKAASYPNLEIIGWFHTHPALGVFYSSDDVVVHSAAFTLPWHVGLVVDPIRNEACFFGWQQGEITPFTGFYETLDTQPEPVVGWRVVRTSVWHSYEEPLYDADDTTQTYASGISNQSSSNLLTGMLLGIAGVLVTFFLLVGWVFVLNQRVNQMETVVLAMGSQAPAASNAVVCDDPNMRILAPLMGQTAVSGDKIEIIGTADIAAASRYRLESRLTGSTGEWQTVAVQRRSTTFGKLSIWNTTEMLPGLYDIRLVAVDKNNIRLADAPSCTIEIALTALP
jgi:proteasome lid subunit RPN8/RPN11